MKILKKFANPKYAKLVSAEKLGQIWKKIAIW